MDGIKEFIERIREAQRIATIEKIEANAIVINTNFVKIPKLIINAGGAVSVLPPMICGLEMYFTDNELPENYSFAICDEGQTERESLIAITKAETAKEALEQFICKLINLRLLSTKEDMYYEMLEVKDELLKEKYGVTE